MNEGMSLEALSGSPCAAVRPDEVHRFNDLLHQHHLLGYNLVGEVIRYIVVDTNALSLWLAIGLRDRYIGWKPNIQLRRLHSVTNKLTILCAS